MTVDGSYAEDFVRHTQLGHSEQEWATQSPLEQHATNSAAHYARSMSNAANDGHQEQTLVAQPPPEQHAAAAADSAAAQSYESGLVGHGHLEQTLLAEEAHPEQRTAAAAGLAPGHLDESSLLALLMENDDMHLLEPGALCQAPSGHGTYTATLVSSEAIDCMTYEGTLVMWLGVHAAVGYLYMTVVQRPSRLAMCRQGHPQSTEPSRRTS